jgi:hypothetical protein
MAAKLPPQESPLGAGSCIGMKQVYRHETPCARGGRGSCMWHKKIHLTLPTVLISYSPHISAKSSLLYCLNTRA